MQSKLWLLLGLGFWALAPSQNLAETPTSQSRLIIKGNALTAPLLMPNVALESQIFPKFSMQLSGFASPWKSLFGGHFQFYMAHLEGRFYLNQNLTGWHIGPHIGFGLFDLTKWNYRGSDKFQRGYTLMLGGTLGYQWQWKDRWVVDVFLGGGNSQGYYHGYENQPPKGWIRYEGQGENRRWNRSGEWLPYQGGVMIGYRLR